MRRFSILLIILVYLSLATSCARFFPRLTGAVDLRSLCSTANLLAAGGTRKAMRCASSPDVHEQLSLEPNLLIAELLLNGGEPERAFPFFRQVILQTDSAPDGVLATAAMVSLIASRDRIPNFDNRIVQLESELRAAENELPPAFWYELNNMALAIARKRGDDVAAQRYRAALGFVTDWQTVGPIGPYAWTYMDRNHPLEGRDSWPRAVPLGPGRPSMAPQSSPSDLGRVFPGDPRQPAHGAVLGRAIVQQKKKGRTWFRLQTGSSCRLAVDGAEVFRLDRRSSSPPYTNWFWVDLNAGFHLLEIKLVGQSPTVPFTISAYRNDGTAAFTATEIGPRSSSGPPSSRGVYVSEPATATHRLATALMALWYDDFYRFELLTAEMTDAERGSPPILLAIAEAALINPQRPADISYESSRALFQKALAADPLLAKARGQLARHALSEGRHKEALGLLAKGTALSPREPLFHSKLIGAYLDAGWHTEATRSIANLQQLLPQSCEPIEWKLALARSIDQQPETRALAYELALCNRLSVEKLNETVRGRDWSAAREEQRRMELAFPRALDVLERRYAWSSALDDNSAFEDALLSAIDLEPALSENYLRLADWRRSRGDRMGAERALRRGMTAIEAPTPTLSKAAAALNNREHLAPYRTNGEPIVDDYFAEAPSYESAAVYVLDRAVYIYQPNGTHTVLVHTLTQVNSAEAIEAHGELDLPDGADILTIRIFGADGDLKEPIYIEGKASLSMPTLAEGDIIEVEYASYNTANQIYPAGFDTDRFFFQDFQTAFHRSEIVVVAPKEMKLQLDPRGAHPQPTIRETEHELVVTYRAKNSAPHPDELAGPNPVEYLPSTRVASNVSWKTIAQRLDDMLADRSVPSPTINRLAASICRGVGTKNCHRALYRYVSGEINHEPDLFAQASHIFARRAGHRTRALIALLREVGSSAQLALVHPSTADQTEGALPSLDQFNEVALLLDGQDWLFPETDNAPFGYLPPRLRNRPAVLLSNGETVQTTAGVIERDMERIQIEIENPTAETVRIVVRETLVGQTAIDWRSALQGGDLPSIQSWFQENYLADAIPGAALLELDFENLDEPENPFILKYKVSLAGYTRPDGTSRVARALFSSVLLVETGGLAKRSTDLVIAAHYDRSVEIAWKLNGNSQCDLSLGEDPLVLESPWGRFRLEHTGIGQHAGYKYSLSLTVPRISPDEYPQFAAFAQRVDRATVIEPIFRSQ